jgi:hypothetical protein
MASASLATEISSSSVVHLTCTNSTSAFNLASSFFSTVRESPDNLPRVTTLSLLFINFDLLVYPWLPSDTIFMINPKFETPAFAEAASRRQAKLPAYRQAGK